MSESTLVDQLFEYVRKVHPRSIRGLQESQDVEPKRFAQVANAYLEWMVGVLKDDAIQVGTDAFVQFSTEVVLDQARYEVDGKYASVSFDEVNARHYSNDEAMEGYLWASYLSNFLWAHHFEIMMFFQDRYVHRLGPSDHVVEIAPGHGGWGIWALAQMSGLTLEGYDISPQAINIASSVATAAGVNDRAKYIEKNALDLNELTADSADGCICSFLVEHLEEPQQVLEAISHMLKPGRTAFVTGALTAAQVDHIYEFRRESEIVSMCENAGLRVLETLSVNPLRMLPNARFMPRSQALIVCKRTNDIY